ncbi:MAG TPA: Uma2 family endonuclease [Pirellulales bacterium]|jgi:Uma2 family endonuclease|nr:Uma2 family endonuclease [Pirellulales bacterium]
MATATEITLPNVELIDSDGEPLETLWHFAAISLLLDVVEFHLRDRTDFYAAGNMFLYYSEEQARNRDYRGPDFFFVDHVDGRRRRRWWAIWEENGRYPDVIMELLSPSTAKTDRTVKKELYEQTFRTHEYFLYDPETDKLEGWRLGRKGRYQAIRPNKRGWLSCEKLALWLGHWTGKHKLVEGVFPRFYDEQERLVLTEAEAARQQATTEKQLAESEKQRADSEKERAELEKQRADQAEAELARLKARLAELEGGRSSG